MQSRDVGYRDTLLLLCSLKQTLFPPPQDDVLAWPEPQMFDRGDAFFLVVPHHEVAPDSAVEEGADKDSREGKDHKHKSDNAQDLFFHLRTSARIEPW